LPNDAAQIRGNVSVAGKLQCSVTIAARQIVRERWSEEEG
jgi:hypothetical protein